MESFTPAIVVIAFNRPASLIKLLCGIANADYGNKSVSLVISIDFQDSKLHQDVVEIATNFVWNFGSKNLIVHESNLGLRNHIISCGDLVEKYNQVIILEDDIRVSADFYNFASQAAEFYDKEDRIAGISLYSYEYEEIGWYKFYPRNIGGDTYFIQWASSWGQLWTKKHWSRFKDWYNLNKDIEKINIPDEVKRWKNSWKKFYIAYMVDQELFFVYPHQSYTTLRDENGTHNLTASRVTNVKVVHNIVKRDFIFSLFSFKELKYDVFFQPVRQEVYVHFLNAVVDLEFDFFGTKKLKNVKSKYLCSIKESKDYKNSFSNKLLPFEDNVFFNEEGTVYSIDLKDSFTNNSSIYSRGKFLYNSRKIFTVKEMVFVVFYRIVSKIFK